MKRIAPLALFGLCTVYWAYGDIRVDEELIETNQIRSARNDPFFDVTEEVAAINLSYGVPAGGTLNGIGWHDLNLAAGPDSGEGVSVENGKPGVTFDYQFVCESDCPGNRGLGDAFIEGDDADTANNVAAGNRYFTIPEGNHAPNIITFHGLLSNNEVYVQLIGGQHGWGDTTTIYVNGNGVDQSDGMLIGDWESNSTDRTASLLGFDATTTDSGGLTVSFDTTRFGGVAGIIVQQGIADGDEDGMPDAWEAENGLDNTDPVDAGEDTLDNDGLTNLEEFRAGTDPKDADSDDDTLTDGVEVNDRKTNPLAADTDGDGLSDAVETATGTFVSNTDTGSNPSNPDTDGDQILDGEEVAKSSDPNDSSDFPSNAPRILADEELTSTEQIRSSMNNPFPSNPAHVAAINLNYGREADGTVNGIGWHDLDLNAAPESEERIAVDNGGAGIRFDYIFRCESDCPGNRGLMGDFDGDDAEVLGNIVADNRYLTIPTSNHAPNIITFHGLETDASVYVQVMGGQHNWTDTTSVYVGGNGEDQDSGTLVGEWQSNTTDRTTGLFAFSAKSSSTGTFRIGFDTTRFGGVAGIIVQQDQTDGDGDGLPDFWEEVNGLDKTNAADAAEDTLDNDGLTNLEEFRNGTDPKDADSDDDGLADGVEVNDRTTNPLAADTDGDGLGDAVETKTGTFVNAANTGTDPKNADTDGDRASDGFEVAEGTDPHNAFDFPLGEILVVVDEPLDSSDQIRTPENMPPFRAAEHVAAINLSYGGVTTSGMVNGAGWHDLDMDADPGSEEGVAVENGGERITFDFQFVCESDCPGNRGLAGELGGDDAEVMLEVLAGNRYLTVPESNHAPNIITFHGLLPKTQVYVQLIGGQHGWGDTTTVYVGGDGIEQNSGTLVGEWESNTTDRTAGLFAFFSTADELGSLRIGFDTTRFGGVAGIVVMQDSAGGTPFQISRVTRDVAQASATITWNSTSGRDYAVEAADDLSVWIELDDGVASQGKETSYTDTDLPPGTRSRYYRVRQQ